MIDKRLKTIEQIQEILHNLNTDTDAQTISVKANLIRTKLNELKGKINVSKQSQQKALKSKDKQYKGLQRKLMESEEKNFKLEKKLKDFQQFHRRKSMYYDKKIGGLFYQNEKYEKLLRKKLAAQERVKEGKKVIWEMEQKLKQYEKFLAASKGVDIQKNQEEMVERVFSKLKTFIQNSQAMGSKQQIEKMRDIIKNQTHYDEKTSNNDHESTLKYSVLEDQDDERGSIIDDEFYDSEQQGEDQKMEMKEFEEEEEEEEEEEKREIIAEEEEVCDMQFLGQEQQSWLDWILSLTAYK